MDMPRFGADATMNEGMELPQIPLHPLLVARAETSSDPDVKAMFDGALPPEGLKEEPGSGGRRDKKPMDRNGRYRDESTDL